MRFKPLPTTTGEWEGAILRSTLVTGLLLLTVQLWARVALTGWMRQLIEEILWVPALLLGFYLVCCSVVALLRRQRLLGFMAAVVAILSALVALLPTLLHEGIIN